ncbi:SDR family NAD(P)-dependent oxidoreductase [Aestuariivirga sp.]|uniref:SDR family NAD(P)-dependent oxidoreductase n=1 Tax=Aestuariivirga sp. TaxID=2650926 RepID=UPI0039E58703
MAQPWRVVWITGASTGIGAEVARQLAADGVIVAISARSAEKLKAAADANSNLKPYPLDVTDAAAVTDCFASIERDLGPVDLVLAAAGTYSPVSLDDFSPAPFRTMYEINFLGVVNVLTAVLPAFRQRRKGHISWIASVAGYRGLPKAAAYGPTKAALINLGESLRPELEADGVAVSVVNPGFVKTPLTAQNDFEMPFLMEVDEAARRTIAGLASGRFEVAYPSRFVTILKIARLLPYRIYFALIRSAVLKR